MNKYHAVRSDNTAMCAIDKLCHNNIAIIFQDVLIHSGHGTRSSSHVHTGQECN